MKINKEITFLEIENTIGKKFKVTRRIPELVVSETKIFRSKEQAVKQFQAWMK